MDLNQLFLDYSDLLYNYTRLRLSDPDEIEDVIQETFLAIMESWDNFRKDSSPSTWMIGILKNKIYDSYRKKIKHSKVISESDIKVNPFDDSGFWIQNQPDSRKTTHEKLEDFFVWDSLLLCVEALPLQHKILYKIREFDKMKTETICKELEISTSNLHVLLHRIRLQLKLCLEKKGISHV